MNFKFDEIYELSKKYGQEHLFAFYDELNNEEQINLLKQVASIDYELINNLYKLAKIELKNEHDLIEPIKSVEALNFTENEIKAFNKAGINLFSQSQVAVITMAGGQGTRLGHDGPKGTFNIGLTSNKSLFEIQCDKLKDMNKLTGSIIPWYIMTSEENNSATIKFFRENNYFNYEIDEIFFFKQGMLPMLNTSGEIILSHKDKVAEGADGNGGLFLSLKKSGALENMIAKGIRWLSICGIDNALVNMTDPAFLGYTINSGKNVAAKSSAKIHPDEKVGVFCKRNGHPGVVEYSEISKEMSNACDELGRFIFNDVNIVVYLFNLDLISKISDKGMPYHTAFKKSNYINENGNLIISEEPNSYKFETFLFDSFSYIEDMIVYRVNREDEFAPVKNKCGSDSPETARKMYLKFMEAKR